MLTNILKTELTEEQINNGEFCIANKHGEIEETKLVELMNKLNNWNGFSRLPHANNYIPCDPVSGQDNHYELRDDLDLEYFPIRHIQLKMIVI